MPTVRGSHPRPSQRRGKVACATLAVFLLNAGTFAAPGDRYSSEKLLSDNELLRKQLDLASGKEFYLLLDTARPALKLMFEGVLLREYEVVEMSAGSPKVFFFGRRPPAGWQDAVWEGGKLDPLRHYARKEIIAPDGSKKEEEEEEVVIPPTPEEAFPAPDHYRIRFDGGLALEILKPGAPESAGRMANVASALWPSSTDRVRVRLVLLADQVEELYRSVPENVRFFMLPAAH